MSATTTPDARSLRDALGSFATGVTVVTATQPDGTPRGFTANSFTSVSLDPPLVLVCVAKTAGSCAIMRASDHMAINILSEDQRDVSASFASRTGTRFEGIDWWQGASGAPILPGTAAVLDCAMERIIEAGDHDILVGRVLAHDHAPRAPLGFCRGAYVSFGAERAALAAADTGDPVSYGMIVEHDEALLLDEGADGTLHLPTARQLGGLTGDLAKAGIKVSPEFIFAVFENEGGTRSFIFYRGMAGTVRREAAHRFRRFDDIDVARLADHPTRTMVARYIGERRENGFGVYTGSDRAGRVAPLAECAATPQGGRI